jgi:hypothetical protein
VIGPLRATALAAVALAGATALAGCSEDSNPPILWLYLDGSELEVKLVDFEPPPF